jgi:hypothetical protein
VQGPVDDARRLHGGTDLSRIAAESLLRSSGAGIWAGHWREAWGVVTSDIAGHLLNPGQIAYL